MATKPTFALPVAAGPSTSTGLLNKELSRVISVTWDEQKRDASALRSEIAATGNALAHRLDHVIASGLLVGEWNAASAAFPTKRPNGTDIREGDMWRVSVAGTVSGQTFAIGDYLQAIRSGGGATFSGNWAKAAIGEMDKMRAATEVASGIAVAAASAIPKNIPFVSIRDFGAVADWDDDAQSGTDNAAAVTAALAYCEETGAALYVPAGAYYTTGNHVVDVTGFCMFGDNGHGHLGQPKLSTIVFGALSGIGLHAPERNTLMEHVRFDASTARRNRGNPLTSGGITNGHGLMFGRDAADATCSRVTLRDVTVARQPTDGIVISASVELADWANVTVEDCCRHAYYFNTGEGVGFANRTVPAFHAQFSNLRAFECGGHALYATADPFGGTHNIFHNFEALGCLWKREHDKSGHTAQICFNYNGTIFHYPDMEDQQYAQTVTQSNGVSRRANAEPAAGMFLASSRGLVEHPYMSSMKKGIIVGGVPGIQINMPRGFRGTWGQSMAPAIEIVSSADYPEVTLSLVQLADHTMSQAIRNQSRTSRVRIDGDDYIGTAFTADDIRIVRQGSLAQAQQILNGTIPYPLATLIEASSETGTTDSFSFFKSRSFAADPVYDGLEVTVRAAAGHTITAVNGVASVPEDDNYGMVLGADRVLSGGAMLKLKFFAGFGHWREIAWYG